ncbi:MAG: hypothetical protein SFW07_03515 [Gammaproteobacteria bacterium]|nr:hypothetical protein [Gammaproteobacteria bacterium]
MEDSTERQVKELSQALTMQQLRDFVVQFPEFSQLPDSLELRYLVSHALLFSAGAFGNDVYLLSRIDAFRGLCLELLQDETANSSLFPWIANVGKGKKGIDNLEKFLINFQKFLVPKIGDIAKSENQKLEKPFFSTEGQS